MALAKTSGAEIMWYEVDEKPIFVQNENNWRKIIMLRTFLSSSNCLVGKLCHKDLKEAASSISCF